MISLVAHDLSISYASKDQAIAFEVVAACKEAGVTC
jgi:hypothetical protein